MIHLKQTATLLIFIIGLISCNNANKLDETENNTVSKDTIKTESKTIVEAIVYDNTIYPVDSLLNVKILTIGSFHNDEVWKNASLEKWFGVFVNKDDVYFAETKLKIKNVFDVVLDENENEKTGWEIKTVNKDTSFILIEGLSFFKNHTIKKILLEKEEVFPGDTLYINYLGIDYKIFATGEKKLIQNEPEWFEVWNYKLYLTATIKGKYYKSLLVAQPNFDDQMVKLIFAGDIDGDGILDLIIDTSRHYNATSPTLYLSKPSDKDELVKPVGCHTSVGC